MADSETATDGSGQYSFTGLRSGTYSVEISGFDTNEVSFSSTSGAATVGVGESKVVSFDGTYLRTAGVQGQVSADGEGLGGVTVTLMGQGAEESKVTDAGGLYAFSQLKSGDYTVAISGYDTDDYEFQTTSKSVTIATGETANVPFEGTLLRTAGIAGRVSVEGMGLDGVTVSLAGAAVAQDTTANGGQYSFAGLAAGTYVLTITNPDDVAYTFDEANLSRNVVLADDQSAIENFEGTHTRTASVSGVLFIDEAPQDEMLSEGEPTIVAALAPLLATLDEEGQMMVAGLLTKAKVMLRGPDLNTVTPIDIDPATGAFTTGASLMAGSYQVELPVNDEEVAAALNAVGVAFVGGSTVVQVDAGGSATANFPFRITMQTISVGAVMGRAAEKEIPADRARVEKVKLTVYANADGTGMLGEAETDAMGMASFTFARDDNTGPAGNDNIVFVRAESPSDALVITDNGFVEVAYSATDRVTSAAAAVRLINVAVNFDFWVKSNGDARNGDQGLGGWHTQVYMGEMTDESEPLMKPDPKDDTKMVNVTMPTDDGEEEMANLGKSSFSYTLTAEALAEGSVPFHVGVTPVAVDEDGKRTDVQPDASGTGEMWEASDALTYEHTGLDLPPGDDDMPTDLGPIHITWTTQALVVGAHRELDDEPGYSQYRSDYPHDDTDTDTRPSNGLLMVELMYSENGGRLKRYEYKKFDAKGERKTDVSNPMPVTGGMATFPNLPTDVDFTVRIRPGANRVAVTERDIDAYGLDDSANRIVGTFGAGAGAMPDVWVCPETDVTPMDEDFKARCSAFGYQWATGTQKVTVTNLRKDVVATVALAPVTDNFSEGQSKDLKGSLNKTTGAIENKSHTFSGIQDGVYAVAVSGSGIGNQKPLPRKFYHDEGTDDDEYDGEVGADAAFSATSLRAEIRGLVANDRSGSGTLTGDEAFDGVELTLHKTKEAEDDAGNDIIVIGDAVKDDDGNAVTATTNAVGEYAFEGLEEKKDYYVKVTECDGCVAYASIDGETHEFVGYAKGTAKVYSATDKNAPPKWNHMATDLNKVITGMGGGFVDFVGLYTDGVVSGVIKEAFDNVGRHRVELERCLTYKAAVPDDETTSDEDESKPATCALRDETFAMDMRTNDDGDWSFGDLREGIYEVDLNPRGSYSVRDDSKPTQLLMLTDGSGATAEADDVSIVDSNKGTETRLRGLVLALASSPGSSLFGATADANVDLVTETTGNTVYEVIADDDAATPFSPTITYPSGTAFTFATDLVLKATAYDKNASITVAVAPTVLDPDDNTNNITQKELAATDFVSVKSGTNTALKRLEGSNTVIIKVTAANGVAESTYTFTFTRAEAQTGFTMLTIAVGCATDANAECGSGISYGNGYSSGTTTGQVDHTVNVSGVLNVEIPHNAHRVSVGGKVGEFLVTATRASGSGFAAISFQVGDAAATSGTDGTADVTTENFVIPAQEGTRTIKITVTSEAETYGVRDKDDPKQEMVWTLNVKRAAPPG